MTRRLLSPAVVGTTAAPASRPRLGVLVGESECPARTLPALLQGNLVPRGLRGTVALGLSSGQDVYGIPEVI